MKKFLFFGGISTTLMVSLLNACSIDRKIETSVTGVLLSQSIAVLTPGGTLNLMATVFPLDASNQSVSWTSSDPEVATVSSGLVTATTEGSATITVTTEDGNKTAICLVSVAEAIPTMISMQQSGIETVTIGIQGTGATTIDWGDGSSPETSPDPQSNTHIYSGTPLRTITIIGENITQVNCSNMGVQSLTLNNNNTLNTIICSGNQITVLDVHECSALMLLYCNDNQIMSLNVQGCSGLTELWCYDNRLTSLDVSDCDALIKLWCQRNLLSTLNMGRCAALINIDCDYNQLISINVSASVLLTSLRCTHNLLQAPALNALFESLHRNSISTGKNVFIGNNPGSGSCNRSIATRKGWVIY